MAVVETLVGRQPIFDGDLSVTGYQLLFRDVDDGGPGDDADGRPTPDALLGGADNLGALVGAKKAFCIAGQGVMSGAVPIVVPSERVVVEVRQPATVDESVLAGCRRLRDGGYSVAIEDFRWSDGARDLLEVASTVKVEAASLDPGDVAELVSECRRSGVEVIAQGIDTLEQMARCEALGLGLYQGYLLSRPHAAPGRPLAPGRLAGLRMSAKLLDAECSASELEEIVRSDPAMTHQVLQLAGIGAAGGMKRTVQTIRQALVLVGWRRLQSWVALLLLSDNGEACEEEIAAVLMRARMSELLAPSAGCVPDAGYTAGLLSTLDVVLGMPIERILDELPLDHEVRDAVLSGAGPLGHLVADVADFQLGRLEQAARSGIGPDTMIGAAVEALTWTVGMTSALEAGRDLP